MKTLILSILLVGCGKLVDVSVPKKIETFAGANFPEAAQFCDTRYGYKTIESEACFTDYRNYFKVLSTANTLQVGQFCQQYTDPVEKAACESNLNDFIFGTK